MNRKQCKRLFEDKKKFDLGSRDCGYEEGERFAKNTSYEVLHAFFVLGQITDDCSDAIKEAYASYNNIYYPAFVIGFNEGARKIWNELQDKLNRKKNS